MKKYLLFLLLGVVLMLGSCRCRKMVPDNGERLQEEKIDPVFVLERQGNSSEEVFANDSIPLVLKETAQSKKCDQVKCKIVGLGKDQGVLYLEENGVEAAKPLAEGDYVTIEKGSLPLMFRPSAQVFYSPYEVAHAYISIELEPEDGKKANVRLDLFLKPAAGITLTTPNEIHTGEEETITLEITSKDPDEEFTIQSISPEYGEVELIYASGEYVHIGDKLKGGVHQLKYMVHRSDHEEQKVALDGYTTYKGSDIREWKKKSKLEISLSDSKENKYYAKSDHTLYNVYFTIEDLYVHWSPGTIPPGFFGMGENENDNYLRGYYKFEFKIQQRDAWKGAYGGLPYKIRSCKSSDGSSVSLIKREINYGCNYRDRNMIGEKMEWGEKNLYFRLEELSLGTDSKIIIEIEGPRGIVKELVVEVSADDKDFILDNKISSKMLELNNKIFKKKEYGEDYYNLSRELRDVLSEGKRLAGPSLYGHTWLAKREMWKNREKAHELGLKAAFFLSEVEEMKDEVKKNPGLMGRLTKHTVDLMEGRIKEVEEIERLKEELNGVYGFNF
jgi:hypothetical protein